MPTGRKAMKGGEGRRVGNMELLLFEAAKQGSSVELGYVLELPEAEKGINYQDQHGHSALMVAARNGHLGCVKLLLGRGASLGLTTHRGGQQVTAIQLAKKAGHTEVLHYLQNCLTDLMKIGTTRAKLEADVERVASTSLPSPEQLVHFSTCLQTLITHCDFDLNNPGDMPLLIRATKASNVPVVLELINKYKATPLINELNTGHNVLHLSCLHRSELRYYYAKHFPSLLRNPDSTGTVPLHIACAKNDTEFIEWLFGKILSEESGMDQFCTSTELKRSNSLPDIPKGRLIRKISSRKSSIKRLSGQRDTGMPVSLLSPVASLPIIHPTHRRVKSGGNLDVMAYSRGNSSPMELRDAGLLFSFDSTSSRSNTVSWHSCNSRDSNSIESSIDSRGLQESNDSNRTKSDGGPNLRDSSVPRDSVSPEREGESATPLPIPDTVATNGHSPDDPLGLESILAEPPLSVNEVVEMKPFRVDMSGQTILHILAKEGHSQLLASILKVADYIKRSVDFNLLIHRDNSRLPIEVAIQSQSKECVRLLVHFTILAGLLEELLKDTLIVKTAVFTGDIEVVKVLLEFGFISGLGQAIAMAMFNEFPLILRLLLFYHTQVINSLEYSRVKRNRQVVLDKGGINWDGLQLERVDPTWLCDSYDAVDSVSRAFDLDTVLMTPEGNIDFYRQLGKDCLLYFNERLNAPTTSHPRRPLTMVTEVNASSNQLTDVPQELFQMPYLQVLILSHNELTSLPTCSDPYTNIYTSPIQKLELDCNQLETLPEDMFRGVAHSLEELSIERNLLKTLPPGLWVCPKLRVLKLSRNQLSHLHYLSDPCYYVDLDLTKRVIGSFTSEERQLVCTADINVCSPGRKKLLKSAEIYLRRVTSFYITLLAVQKPLECLLKHDIYQEVISMHLARNLYYSHTENGMEPGQYQNSQLLLPGDEDEELVVGSLVKLESLDLSLNRFTEMPWDLPCIAPQLNKLEMHGNALCDLDIVHSLPLGIHSVFLARNSLVALDKHRSVSLPCGDPLRLLTLPEQNFGNRFCRHCRHEVLENLTLLSLDSNQLSSLPVVDVIDEYTHDSELQDVFDMGTVNYLVYYPNLSILSLEKNLLTKVPPQLHHLTHLSSLSLSYNKIHELPPELGLINPQQLLLLKMEGLFLKNIPENLLHRPTPKHLLSYLKALLQKSRPYRRIKLMVVGAANKGKTSLLLNLTKKGRINRCKDVAMSFNNVPLATVGVELGDWEYSPNNKAPKVTFMTWDFGGQAEYYATHQCFLTKRSLYILVWDVTDGEQGLLDLQPWLENIEGRAPESPVFVLATHADKLPADSKKERLERLKARFRELYIDYPNSRYMYPRVHRHCFFVNCFDSKHMDNLRDVIYDFVTKYKAPAPKYLMSEMDPLLEQLIPASYLVLEDIVRSLAEQCKKEARQPIYTKQEFISAVKDHEAGYYEKLGELDQATHFLHDNGLLLHYEDSSLLSDLYFVDPQWLCSMLAKVITVQEKNPYQKNGFMSVDDLYKIFPSFVTQFVTLMQRFEVVLLLDSRRMLIPSLLPTLEADSIVVFIRSVSHSLLDKRLTRLTSSESEEDHNPVSQEVPHAPLCQTPYPIVSRYYVLSFVPKGFFTRVIARLMSKDIMDHLHESLLRSRLEENHLLNAPHWRCWRDGISIIWNHMEIFRIAPVNYPLIGMHTTVLLSNTGRQEVQTLNGVEIKVAILPEELVNTCSMIPNVDVAEECYKGRCIASWLLHQAVTVIDSVFEDWYEAFSKKKGFELSTISSGSPCTTCFRAMQTAEVMATTTPLQRRHSTFSKSYDVIKRWSVDEKTMYLFSSMFCSLALEKGVCLCCPTHGDIKVAEVAPDLVFSDFPSYKVFPDPSAVVIKKELGAGGFGKVSKATLKQSCGLVVNVAVKEFYSDMMYIEQDERAMAELKSWDIYQKASQEARVMLPLCHDHILGLIGLTFQPLRLLVELAPMGDLKDCVKTFQKARIRLSRITLKHTLIQTAEALQYLHSKNFIYRDLKPDNVLVWKYPTPDTQWSSGVCVFVKVADYGISKEVTPQGIRGMEGTQPYLAPEVLLNGGKEAYSQQMDVYAFGMFIYYLSSFMTPFENDTRPITALLEEGRRPELLSKLHPRSLQMFELMCWCWSELPQHRPKLDQIVDTLKADTFTSLLAAIPLTRDGDEVTTASIHSTYTRRSSITSYHSKSASSMFAGGNGVDFSLTHTDAMSLIAGGPGEELTTQVWYGTDRGNVGVIQFQRGGVIKDDVELPAKRKKYILNVSVVDKNVWICTAGAGLWVYNVATRQPIASWGEDDKQQIYTLLNVTDASTILALTHKGMYTFDSDLGPCSPDYGTLYPTRCIPRSSGRELNEGIVIPSGANLTDTEVWVCSQTALHFYILDSSFNVAREISPPTQEGEGHKVRHMTTTVLSGRRVLLVADRHIILYWDVANRERIAERGFDCSEACKAVYGDINPRVSRVTSLLTGGDFLYVGTRGGVILILDSTTMSLHKLLHANSKPVRSLMLAQPNNDDSPSVFRRLFSRKDLRQLSRLSSSSLSGKSLSSSSMQSIDSPPSNRAVLVSLGMGYRSVIGNADNHHSVFLMPSDGSKANNKLAKVPLHHGHLLLWSAETTRTAVSTNETQGCGNEATMPGLCEEVEELSDELFESGD